MHLAISAAKSIGCVVGLFSFKKKMIIIIFFYFLIVNIHAQTIKEGLFIFFIKVVNLILKKNILNIKVKLQ